MYVLLQYISTPGSREIAKKIGEGRDIPVETKKIGIAYYLYRDKTRWNKEKKRLFSLSQ